jgi:hypothetical protein
MEVDMLKIIVVFMSITLFLGAKESKIDKEKKSVKKIEKVETLAKENIVKEEYNATLNYKKISSINEINSLTLDIKPKGEWHINTGFPIKFKVNANCLKADKVKYKKKDAKTVTEKNILLNINTKCNKKTNDEITLTGAFGVCKANMCKRKTLKVKVKVEVK